jgi:hypothetical protein
VDDNIGAKNEIKKTKVFFKVEHILKSFIGAQNCKKNVYNCNLQMLIVGAGSTLLLIQVL